MQVKKFEAPSMELALAKVKESFGPNALVLSTQQKKKGWFQKPTVEVTAAFQKPRAAASTPGRVSGSSSVNEETLARVFPHRRRPSATDLVETVETVAPVETDAPAESVRKTNLGRYRDLAGKKKETPAQLYERELRQTGFSEKSAQDITRRLIFDYEPERRKDPRALFRAKTDLVRAGLKAVSQMEFESHSRWVFIGVGGAGKTSTIVKLAMHLKREGRQVRLVCGDSRKVTGRAELGHYGRIIGAPVSFEANIRGPLDEVHLVDTPAALPGPDEGLEELCRLGRVVIVLDGTSRMTEQLRMVESWRPYNPAAVTFTRFDIASQLGGIYDLTKAINLPMLGASMAASYKTPYRFFNVDELLVETLLPGF